MSRQELHFNARAEAIDKTTGILSGVSMVTIGPVKTHGVYADTKTLETVKACAETHTGGLRVKMEHGKGAGAIVGVLKGYRIDGQQLRADLHLLKTGEHFSKLMEMSETIPEAFGLSIACSGDRERIKVAEVDVEALRCQEIYSCDIVDGPAANPNGLFSVKRAKRRMKFQDDSATLEEIDDAVLDIQETVNSIESDLTAIAATEAAILAGVQAIQTMLPELVEAAVKRGANGDVLALRRLGSMGVPAGTVPPASKQPPADPPKTLRAQLEAIPANDFMGRKKFLAEHKDDIYAELQKQRT